MRINILLIILFAAWFYACSTAQRSAAPIDTKAEVNSAAVNRASMQGKPTNSTANKFSAGTADTGEPIVGKWRDVKTGTVVQFFKEGTFLMDDLASKQWITGRYKQLDENNLKLTLDLPMSRPAIVKYKIVGNNLELGSPDSSAGMSQFSRISQ